MVTIQSIPEIHGKLISVLNYRTLKQKIFGLYWTLTYLFLAFFCRSDSFLSGYLVSHFYKATDFDAGRAAKCNIEAKLHLV